jgi:hypothetical protein
MSFVYGPPAGPLSLVSSACGLAVAGCLGLSGSEPDEQETPSPVREWARDAESTAPVRATGTPISLDRTITDDPGYEQDNMEYFPENRTVRYVKARIGGEPVAYDTWTFEEWGRIETATNGATRARTVSANRLDVESVGGGISSAPGDAEATNPVIVVHITKTLDREGKVVEWPVATFPDLKRGDGEHPLQAAGGPRRR